MKWILIILVIIIIFLFLLAYEGLKNSNNIPPSNNTDTDIKLSALPRLECTKNKVTCDVTTTSKSVDCSNKCSENEEELICQPIDEYIPKEYSYTFRKQEIAVLYKGDKNVSNVTSITIPLKDKDGNDVKDISTLNDTTSIYINFKPTINNGEENILNGQYGDFVDYDKNSYVVKRDEGITTINISYKASNDKYNITDDGDVIIKWFNIKKETNKYCVPKKPDLNCDITKGGILTWTGWSNPNNMGWSCVCRYPAFYNGNDCGQKNPNVCSGGTFTWNDPKVPPTNVSCQCKSGDTLVRDYRGVPYCVDQNLQPWYTSYFTPEGTIIQEARIKK
jgi:hypothetical protein